MVPMLLNRKFAAVDVQCSIVLKRMRCSMISDAIASRLIPDSTAVSVILASASSTEQSACTLTMPCA